MFKRQIFCAPKILLTFLYLWMNVTALPVSVNPSPNGYPISVTPFDQKLSQCGFFNLNRNPVADTFPGFGSLQNLFFVAKSFRYVSDGSRDHWQTPQETEVKRSGDCEDKALWLITKLKQSGFSNLRLVIGRYRNFDKKLHVWLTYTTPTGKTYLLDPTIQKRVWNISDFDSKVYIPLLAYENGNRYFYGRTGFRSIP